MNARLTESSPRPFIPKILRQQPKFFFHKIINARACFAKSRIKCNQANERHSKVHSTTELEHFRSTSRTDEGGEKKREKLTAAFANWQTGNRTWALLSRLTTRSSSTRSHARASSGNRAGSSRVGPRVTAVTSVTGNAAANACGKRVTVSSERAVSFLTAVYTPHAPPQQIFSHAFPPSPATLSCTSPQFQPPLSTYQVEAPLERVKARKMRQHRRARISRQMVCLACTALVAKRSNSDNHDDPQ